MPKRSLRQQMLARRRALSQADWNLSSHAAQERLLALEEFKQAECIALYAPAHKETDTNLILSSAMALGKRVLYPAVKRDELVFRQVQGIACLSPGCFGLLEPRQNGVDHQADEPDLIVVPGVVFDTHGHRIGYGKGFYDRFLDHPGRSACLLGLCHDFQLIEEAIPAEGHDIRIDIIVTDRRVVRIDI